MEPSQQKNLPLLEIANMAAYGIKFSCPLGNWKCVYGSYFQWQMSTYQSEKMFTGPWALKHYQTFGVCKIYYSHFIF